MQEKLIIKMNANDMTHPDWVVVNADDKMMEVMIGGDTQALESIAKERDVEVIIPSEQVMLAKATLPKMNRAKLLKAVPFALEEQLVDDVKQLHFAMTPQNENGVIDVAIVSHHNMQQWMDLLKEWHILPDAMIPEIFALPCHQGWTAAVANTVTTRTGNESGFTCDAANFAEFLNLAITEKGEVPQFIHLYNTTKQAIAGNLRVTAKVEEEFISDEDLLKLMAQSLENLPPINLLQGPYVVRKRKFPKRDKLWKISAYLGGTLLALFIFNPLVSYFILSHRLNQINDQMMETYQHIFPKATSMVAPKMRVSDKLQTLEAQAGENRLLILLGKVSKSFSSSTNIKIKRADFQNNLLTLDVSAASSDDFSKFTDLLAQQGLNAKQENANFSGTRINAILQIE